MNTVVIEHVALNELPAAWRAQFHASKNTRVTVRIEEEEAEPTAASALASNPLFGMWQDREETADVAAYARKLRAPRCNARVPGVRAAEAIAFVQLCLAH